MKCPFCRETNTDIYNTRRTKFGSQIWRRRRCLSCGQTFTSYEQPDISFLRITSPQTKKPAPYSRASLFSSIYLSFSGSTAKPSTIDAVTDTVEAKLLDLQQDLVSTTEIIDIVLAALKHFDNAAFLRYLSEHVDITNPGTMRKYLKKY